MKKYKSLQNNKAQDETQMAMTNEDFPGVVKMSFSMKYETS